MCYVSHWYLFLLSPSPIFSERLVYLQLSNYTILSYYCLTDTITEFMWETRKHAVSVNRSAPDKMHELHEVP